MWQSRYASGEVVMSVVKLGHLQECCKCVSEVTLKLFSCHSWMCSLSLASLASLSLAPLESGLLRSLAVLIYNISLL